MFRITFIIIVAIVIFFPHFWVRRIIKKYSISDSTITGTGGQLAEYLLDQLNIKDIIVTQSQNPNENYFHPQENIIYLDEQTYKGKSLAAIAIAAHEVGHAMQYQEGSSLFDIRNFFITVMSFLQKIFSFIFIVSLIVAFFIKIPIFLYSGSIWIVIGSINVLIHLVTLPLEFDASFSKALPLLIREGIIEEEQEAAIKSILKAAAFTYVSSALFNIARLFTWGRFVKK